MTGARRYLRLMGAFARYCLANELAFRGNFIAKIILEVLWLGILLVFYDTIFANTRVVAGWDKSQYLVFVGCYYTLEGIIETFFLENCSEFSELIRTGELDFFLLKPIDEQFLITCRKIDWSTAPKIPTGGAIIAWGLNQMHWEWDGLRVVSFCLVFLCAIVMAYSFLITLTSAGVWMVRNQSLMELWWLVTSLMRYPKEIYDGSWAWLIGRFFTYVLPLLLVINMPAQVLAKALDPRLIALTATSTFILLVGSRWIFFRALKSYRSASS
jgi:ABC-2 type transport system permease protein